MIFPRILLTSWLLISSQSVPVRALRGEAAHRQDRRLAHELFFSYQPVTTVTDDAAVDLDLQLIETQLDLITDEGVRVATEVYMKGAFSKSVSNLTIPKGILIDIPKGEEVFGMSEQGNFVRGKVLANTKSGATVIPVQYHASPVQTSWTNCHVGGNPNPNIAGCFATSGSVEIGGLGMFDYNYEPLQDTYNERSFQGFSTKAQEKMYACDTGCPYSIYMKFYNYYGAFDYGNQWILAALNKTQTSFKNGNADFSGYGMAGIAEAFKKGATHMNTWMYVLKELEHAVYLCETNEKCDDEECTSPDMVHPWDKSVAFYAGGQIKQPIGDGYMLYHLAQKKCTEFKTCIAEGNVQMAMVNQLVFNFFNAGRDKLLAGQCGEARKHFQSIIEQMTVPLVQGLLLHAHRQSYQNVRLEKDLAEGATYAASLLPIVHNCSEADAVIVYTNMRVGNGGTADYSAVRAALERNYKCMGLTCADVGGLVDSVTGEYMQYAAPCADESTAHMENIDKVNARESSSSTTTTGTTTGGGGIKVAPDVGKAVGITVGVVVGLVLIAFIVSRKRDMREYDGYADSEVA